MKILVTGFEPFGGEAVNPAAEVLDLLPDNPLPGLALVRAVLPCAFETSHNELYRRIEACEPRVVICLGQAGGRQGLTMEKVAVNLQEARIPDNLGFQPVDQAVSPGGPTAFFASLPVKRMARAARDAGIPASVSYSAGTFVCNHIMYKLLEFAQRHRELGIRGGFIHIPYMTSQTVDKAGTCSLSLEETARGLTAAIKSALDGVELQIPEGRIC